jgi:hypothetical protein
MAITVGTAFTEFTVPSFDGQFYVQYSITVEPGQNMMFVGISAGVVASVVFNGVSMGAAKVFAATGNVSRLSIYDLLNPSVGTHNLRINLNNGTNLRVLVVSMSGVHPITPRGPTPVFTGGSFSPPRVATAATTLGDVVVDLIIVEGFALTPAVGQTVMLNTPTADATIFTGASYKEATGTSTVLSWNFTANWSAYGAITYKPNPYETPRSIIQLGNTGNSNIILSSTGTSPITIR